MLENPLRKHAMLVASLAIGAASESSKAAALSPIMERKQKEAPVITEEEIQNTQELATAAVVVWVDGPVPDGVILPKDADSKRIVVNDKNHPVGFPSEQAALEFFDSERSKPLLELLTQQGATSVGIKALNGGGVPLWDMALYSVEGDS